MCYYSITVNLANKNAMSEKSPLSSPQKIVEHANIVAVEGYRPRQDRDPDIQDFIEQQTFGENDSPSQAEDDLSYEQKLIHSRTFGTAEPTSYDELGDTSHKNHLSPEAVILGKPSEAKISGIDAAELSNSTHEVRGNTVGPNEARSKVEAAHGAANQPEKTSKPSQAEIDDRNMKMAISGGANLTPREAKFVQLLEDDNRRQANKLIPILGWTGYGYKIRLAAYQMELKDKEIIGLTRWGIKVRLRAHQEYNKKLAQTGGKFNRKDYKKMLKQVREARFSHPAYTKRLRQLRKERKNDSFIKQRMGGLSRFGGIPMMFVPFTDSFHQWLNSYRDMEKDQELKLFQENQERHNKYQETLKKQSKGKGN